MNRLPKMDRKRCVDMPLEELSLLISNKRSRRDRTAAESYLLSNPIRDLSISSGEKSGSYQHLENNGLIPS
jgi:hypothetical protein